MTTGTLTFTERPDGTVNVHVDFGPGGLDEESDVHFLLLLAVNAAMNANVPADAEDGDE